MLSADSNIKQILLSLSQTLGALEHSSSCCCSNHNMGTLLLCISVSCAVSVDVLTYAVDLRKKILRNNLNIPKAFVSSPMTLHYVFKHYFDFLGGPFS